MFYILLYTYITSIGLSFVAGLFSFRYNYPKYLKAFCVFLGLSFLIEIVANEIFPALHLNHYRNALYNCFSLVEIIFYTYFFYCLTDIKWIKNVQIAFIFLFPLVWAKLVFDKDGFYSWHGDQIAVGGFFIVCFALLYIYHLSKSEDVINLSRHSEFWIAIALVLFYSCETPFMGTLIYLSAHYLALAKFLLKFSMALNALMYFLFTYAFICRKNRS